MAQSKVHEIKRVCGINMGHVNHSVMTQFCKEKLQIDGRGKKEEELVRIIAAHFHKAPARNTGCGKCDGFSDLLAFDVCPFCGDDDEASASDDAQLHVVTTHKMIAADKPVVPSILAGGAVRNLDDLMRWEQQFALVQQDTAEKMWVLGHQLMLCSQDNLWRLRTDAAGKQMYFAFDEYARICLGIGRKLLFQIMLLAKDFPLALVSKYSKRVLWQMLTLPRDARAALLLEAKETELTERQVADRAIALKQKQLKEAISPPRQVSPETGEVLPANKPKVLTVVAKTTKYIVKMKQYGDEDVRATKQMDRSTGFIKLERGEVVVEHSYDDHGLGVLTVKFLPNAD